MNWLESWLPLVVAALPGTITPARCCQAIFLLAAGGVLAVAVMPRDAKALLMDYGARKAQQQQPQQQQSKRQDSRDPKEQRQQQRSHATLQRQDTQNHLLSLLDALTAWTQVPHSWFSAFYIVSVACSVFWVAQYFTDGAILRLVASSQAKAQTAESQQQQQQPPSSATLEQVALGWLLMLLQGSRRVFEHVMVIKPSKSTMWVVHWVLGLLFYVTINVTVWVEGSSMRILVSFPGQINPIPVLVGLLEDILADRSTDAIMDPRARHTDDDAHARWKMAAALPVFLFAWVNQYRCHKHLAGLKKYSLPEGGMFRHYVCPHYTCECLLYLSMAVATAPRGQWWNQTLLCAVVFVVVNLGVTAAGTRKWYADKFGAESVANKWNMIPFVC